MCIVGGEGEGGDLPSPNSHQSSRLMYTNNNNTFPGGVEETGEVVRWEGVRGK